VDFGKADASTWSMLKAELAPLQVGVLVNNVGVSYPHAEYYEAIDDQLIDDLININIQATNKVCCSRYSSSSASLLDTKPFPLLVVRVEGA
jgi:short-subunit dehydrogenase